MTIKQISKSVFKAKALEIFRAVEISGEPVIVTDHGRPTLEVRPYQDTVRQPLDVLRGSLVCYLEPTEPVGAEDWDAAQ